MIEDDALFKLEILPTRPYTKDFNAMIDITIEMNRDLAVIQRNGYTLLDLLSDTGGVQSILLSGFAVLISLLNYKHFDTYIASQLFKLRKPGAKNSGVMEFFHPTKYGNLKELCQDLVGCCRFFRKSPRARMIEKARQTLEQEVNIIDIVKSRRYFQMALVNLLPQKKLEELQEKSRYFYIFPSSCDEDEPAKASTAKTTQAEIFDPINQTASDGNTSNLKAMSLDSYTNRHDSEEGKIQA